jgi:hypothetical protein
MPQNTDHIRPSPDILRAQTISERVKRCGVEKPNHWHGRLLRVRRKRPRRRAAEQREEVAPVVIESHAIPHDERGRTRYRIAGDQSAASRAIQNPPAARQCRRSPGGL